MAAALPWVILRRVLVRKDDTEAAETEDPVAISTALRAPPRVTILSVAVAPNAHPGRPIRSDELPYLVATGPTALLLCFFAGSVPIVTDELILAWKFVAPADASRQPTTAGSADRVPPRTGPSMPVTYNIRNVGLIPRVFGGGYVIAELQVTKRSNRAKLFRLISGDVRWSEPGRLFFVGAGDTVRQWFETELDYPLSAMEREWAPNGVVAHANQLWWFDLSWGLLSCDPSDLLHPVLIFHDLPPGCYLSDTRPFLHTIRCICVSENMLRYVGTARDYHPDGSIGEKKVVMWTWIPADPSGGGDEWKWQKSYETDFKDIWNDGSYQATGLPALVPQIVLISPTNHNVVYFFLNKVFFGVDVPSHRVVHFVKDCHKLEAPVSRHCVLPWNLPSSIVNGLVEDIVPFPEQGGSPSTSSGTCD